MYVPFYHAVKQDDSNQRVHVWISKILLYILIAYFPKITFSTINVVPPKRLSLTDKMSDIHPKTPSL